MKISTKGDNKLQLDFGNGIYVSTIWGYCSHTDNYDGEDYTPGEEDDIAGKFKFKYESTNVEVMVSCSDEKWLEKLHKKYDKWSAGRILFDYLPLKEWVKLLQDCAKYKKTVTNP